MPEILLETKNSGIQESNKNREEGNKREIEEDLYNQKTVNSMPIARQVQKNWSVELRKP